MPGVTNGQAIVLAPSVARTASGNGDALDLTQFSDRGSFPPMLLVQADVTAITGTATPTITFLVEDGIDGVNWNTVGTFAAITTVSRLTIAIGIRGDAYPAGFRWPFNPRRVRCRWTISGTNPSLTSNVKAIIL